MRTWRAFARGPGVLRGALRFIGDCRGVAGAEMALVFPVVGFVMLNVVDFAVFTYSKMQVDVAATQAVGVARVLCDTPGTCPADLVDQMTAAATQTKLGTRVTPVGIPTQNDYCANAGGTLVAVSGPPSDCSTVVTGSTAKPGKYINATYSFAYSPIFPGVSVVSYLSPTIQSTAWMRLQ